MQISIYVHDELIESVEVDFKFCKTKERMEKKINYAANYLKQKYKDALCFMYEWEIVLEGVESRVK